ncbi:MAG: hypothetical protein E3J35_02380 [Methanomassiliicoccales archaeon]|nr:MAG: hypothetical protein E3J35_02380 [Methanomassiliicoccales archaeon]
MRKTKDTIALALELFYEGQSLRKVKRMLKKFAKVDVSHDVIWDWIQKYTPEVRKFVSNFRPELSVIVSKERRHPALGQRDRGLQLHNSGNCATSRLSVVIICGLGLLCPQFSKKVFPF